MVGAAIQPPDDAGHNRVCARRVEVGAVRPDGRRCSFGNEQKARMSASAPDPHDGGIGEALGELLHYWAG